LNSIVFNSQPGDFIKGALLERVKNNPSYSLRALARDLGVSHGYLSLVINGKKKVSLKRVLPFVQALGLEKSQAELFKECVLLTHAQPTKNKTAADGRGNSDWFILELERFKVMSEWYHIPILELTLLDGFKATSKNISERLELPYDVTKKALGRLEKLGLLSRQSGVWKKEKRKLAIPVSDPNRAIRYYHRQMIHKGLRALELGDQDFGFRDFTGATMPLNPKRLGAAKKKIEKFRKNLMRFLSTGPCSEIYQLNVQLFRLTKAKNKRNRNEE
jgi:uncharacterized protein (TIGR02147 family)